MCEVWNCPEDKTELLGTLSRGVTWADNLSCHMAGARPQEMTLVVQQGAFHVP